VCEIWKWIIIATAVPLGVTWFFGEPITYLWFIDPNIFPRLRRIPYSRAWWTGVAVLLIASATYGLHCR
jgi:hypothetical protein